MSEPRLISPMLDGCLIGEAISCHNGIRCCPAIREQTGEKYIVKILSIPASQVQLEALLLTGAFSDSQGALDYFLELAQDVLKDKDILAKLSQLEGFAPYTHGQIVPMEEGTGFEVYLMSPYKTAVDSILSNHTLTHLSVVNMGLDLCAALAACRRAGYLYVDLKPSNIFLGEDRSYRIGDLGFVPMGSLKYTALPEKFHSPYTAPEVLDPMAVLNSTVDIYALGLVLYQAYNGGNLPQLPATVPPMYADYEMAEIILKACAADPKQRYQEPAQMAQALVSYMQRNSVNDTPIIPPVMAPQEPEEEPEAEEEFLPERDPEPEELAFLQELTQDETAPSEENAGNLTDAELTEETAQMLLQADELIAHVLPEPVIAPEPVEISLPEPVQEDIEATPEPEPEVQEEAALEDPSEAEPEALEEIPVQQEVPEKPKAETARSSGASKRNVALTCLTLLLIALLVGIAFGGWYTYENIYLQNINGLSVSGTSQMLTVKIDSRIDDSLLTVVCTDIYGNPYTSPVSGGVAVFQELEPNTRYSIRVEISGFHKLTGRYSTSFTTARQIHISSFAASIGPTDGSVLLRFSPDSLGDDEWYITYGAADISTNTVMFSGRSIMLTDLVLGKEYTFTLSSQHEDELTGQTQVTFTPKTLVFAENLAVESYHSGSLTAVWEAPENEQVSTWVVRCYNDGGYDQTLATSDTRCTFTGLDSDSSYTLEVFAAGMEQSVFVQVSARTVTITNYAFEIDPDGQLVLRWEFSGPEPEGGWVIAYTISSEPMASILCEESQVSVPLATNAVYSFLIQAADGATVINGNAQYPME